MSTNQQREGEIILDILKRVDLHACFIEKRLPRTYILTPEVMEPFYSFIKETLATERERVLGEVANGLDSLTRYGTHLGNDWANKREDIEALITSLKNK